MFDYDKDVTHHHGLFINLFEFNCIITSEGKNKINIKVKLVPTDGIRNVLGWLGGVDRGEGSNQRRRKTERHMRRWRRLRFG